MNKATDCIIDDFNTSWYKKWSKEMGYPPARHPKFWESAIIAESLKRGKFLKKGKRGIVFGAGSEQLVSVFANRKVFITATDQSPTSIEAKKWDNGQLSKNAESLFYKNIIDKEKFDNYVEYQHYDMNKYNPKYFNTYDFIWHNCVVGHIGSMKKSYAHLERSAKYLKDGGMLAFTTELNISSQDKTISENSDTIIWRLKDLLQMFERMSLMGMEASRFKLRLGDKPEDLRINYDNGAWMTRDEKLLNNPSYSEIKISFANYVITQIFLSFRKSGVKKAQRALKKHKKDFQNNLIVLNKFIRNNSDLQLYEKIYKSEDILKAKISPLTKKIIINAEPGAIIDVPLKYMNRSFLTFFGFGPHWPENHKPLVLGTSSPVNRISNLYHESWFSANRPAVNFLNLTANMQPKELNVNKEMVNRGEQFEYIVRLKAPSKAGTYSEKFNLIVESLGVLGEASEIEIVINVEDQAGKNRNRGIFISEFFKKSSINKVINTNTINNFLEYFKTLEKSEFRIRTNIDLYELEVLFVSYVKNCSHISKIKEQLLHDKFSEYRGKCTIKINYRYSLSHITPSIYFIVATPRSGNTAITEALSRSTSIPNTTSEMKLSNYYRAEGPLFVKNHIGYDKFINNIDRSINYKTVTIARHPFDVLLSAFRFSQKTPGCSAWLGGAVFPVPLMYKNKNPLSEEFRQWSLGKGAEQMLNITLSWVDHADEIVRYEDFIKDEVATVKKTLKKLNLYNQQDAIIANATKYVKNDFLVGFYNEHRWTSGYENWPKYFTPEISDELHRKYGYIFQALGYKYNYPQNYSLSSVIKNNDNWS